MEYLHIQPISLSILIFFFITYGDIIIAPLLFIITFPIGVGLMTSSIGHALVHLSQVRRAFTLAVW
jgi:hypothetical protein